MESGHRDHVQHPDAADAIAEAARRHGDAIYLGAGTVLTAAQAHEAVEAGATFLVSPGTDDAVVAAMRGTGVAVFAGALTPSEVMAALRLGVDAVKIFPASLGGPAYLKALRGPFPDVAFMPTGGVSVANISDWLAAGAVAVGAVASCAHRTQWPPGAGTRSRPRPASSLPRTSRQAATDHDRWT